MFIFSDSIHSQTREEQGGYFSKREYSDGKIPTFKDSKEKLPHPVLEENSEWIDMYWKCWEIAFRGFKSPPPGSPFVSNWIDEAFSENIFQWDTIFMIMFARYAHDIFPAIESLDNFYSMQRSSGFIGREYRESDGRLIHFDFDGGLFSENGFKNTINPPLFSWAEVESYRLTGDRSRFEMVIPALTKYAEWLNRDGDPDAKDWESNGRKSKSAIHQLYWNTPLGCGMDNTPRPAEKGAGWVDMSAQMVIMYNNLSVICDKLDKPELAGKYRNKAEEINSRINKWCWNEDDGFYYDVLSDGSQFRKKTAGAFWTLLAGTPNKIQAEKLISHLTNPNEFWRKIVFPTLSADEEEFNQHGGYWLGAVWAPTNLAIIKGLKKYGYNELAAEAAKNYLSGMYEVFKDSNTVYENYAPDFYLPGNPAKRDFVGWTGIGPIELLIENILGFQINGAERQLTWRITRRDKHGIKNLRVGNVTVSVISEKLVNINSPVVITIDCDKKFKFVVIKNGRKNDYNFDTGKHKIIVE
jgi:glycogen debranching enzyme